MALYATNRFPGDGTTTSYEFNFVGKYINRAHVKVYQEDNVTQARTYVSINDSNFLNDTTLRGLPVTPVGSTLVIYRETPKPPLVDFVNGSRFTEYNLDLVARQGLFVAMEAMDAGGSEARQQLVDAIVVATSARDAAVIAKNAAEAALDSFDDRYLGQKPADPANDNDGGALLVGALYFRTTAPIGMKVWTGTTWDDAYANLSSKFDKTGGAIDGNINITGTARRITGDFSNATVANRMMFQTNVANSNTGVIAIPNGTASVAGFRAAGNSDPTNASILDMVVIGNSEARITSSAHGSGALLPLTVHVGGAERLRIDPTTGNVSVQSGTLVCGNGQAAAYPPAGIAVNPTTHATSKRASISIGAWAIGQDSSGNGEKDLFLFDSLAGQHRLRIDPTGNVLATSGALGYGVGAGGTVVQATSKSTAVTLNKPSGRVTFHNSTLAAGASVLVDIVSTFASNSSTATAGLVIGLTANYWDYSVVVVACGGGRLTIRLTNLSASPITQSEVLSFNIIAGATS